MKKLKNESDLTKVRNMKEEDIDYSEIPMFSEELIPSLKVYKNGKLVKQKAVKIPIDSEIINFFKSLGDDWQEQINNTLLRVI